MSEAVKPVSRLRSIIYWGLIAALAVIVAIAALPSYVSGQWPWQTQLEVPQLGELRNLMQTPLALTGWEPELHQEVKIGSQSWSLTQYQSVADGTAGEIGFALLLRPQNDYGKQPQVEWVDLQGAQRWRVNDQHTVTFPVSTEPVAPLQVTARYFRGLAENRTFAVMQWYAWPTGGHFAPGRWFWADQLRQWQQRERLPWVAVSILLPIEPVGDIRPYTDEMVAIAQQVHQSLLATAL